MLPEDDDKLAKMNRNVDSFVMTPRQPFLSALDYIFYIQLHIEKERSEYYGEDERLSSFRTFNTELPKLSEILKKLVDDLQLAFDTFINEFLDNEGIHCLLNLLRLCLNRQQSPGTGKTNGAEISSSKNKSFRNKERHHQLKRALNDEYDCLLCLNFAVKRNAKALQKMVSHKTGLSTLASCIVSNLTKSRLIALQLLTKVCAQPEGVNKVLEAMSTMRIIFGESVRFKFLVSMLNSGNSCSSNGIECNALSLLNALLSKTTNCAEKIRLQCEYCEAGLDIEYLEKVLKQQNIPKDELIWIEIEKFRYQYININDKIKNKRQSVQEKDELKEEVEILQRALNKLEEDKINLMTIERELKEKCEDLEQEVDHLKTKFKVLTPIDKKVSPRTGSDNGTGDSGQWTDSDCEASGGVKRRLKTNHKIERKSEAKSTYNCDLNMRNEEEFIYVPAIHPPPNFGQLVGTDEQVVALKKQNSINNSKRNIKPLNNEREDRSWRQRQRSLSEERTPVVDKPLVVNVHPKQKLNKTSEIYSDSTIGMDRENSELILNWNYAIDSKIDSKIDSRIGNKRSDKESDKSDVRVPAPTPRIMSSSMSQINNINDNIEYRKESYISNKYSELLTSSRQNINNFSFDTHFKSISNALKNNLSQSNGYLSTRNKKKNIRSSLQSYFFSGTSTLKQNKKEFQSDDNFEECPKSFPLPKTYKKNFILKGHGNCGLYSGTINNQLVEKNLSDDLKIAPHFDNLSALVHKEITEAARDIGAWL